MLNHQGLVGDRVPVCSDDFLGWRIFCIRFAMNARRAVQTGLRSLCLTFVYHLFKIIQGLAVTVAGGLSPEAPYALPGALRWFWRTLDSAGSRWLTSAVSVCWEGHIPRNALPFCVGYRRGFLRAPKTHPPCNHEATANATIARGNQWRRTLKYRRGNHTNRQGRWCWFTASYV